MKQARVELRFDTRILPNFAEVLDMPSGAVKQPVAIRMVLLEVIGGHLSPGQHLSVDRQHSPFTILCRAVSEA